MPLPIAHGLLGASIVAALYPQSPITRYSKALFIGAFLANCPDLDFFLVWLLNSKIWHRDFTHSFAFALIFGLIALAFLGMSRRKEVMVYVLAFMSHGVLDYAATKESGGVELLWPFFGERQALGLWGLSEMASRLPIAGILKALLAEIVIFAPLMIVVLLLRWRISQKVSPIRSET